MSEGRGVGFEVLGRGPRSGLEPEEPGLRVADDREEWTRLWGDHEGGEGPDLDPASAWGGLVLLGERPTGGYAVDVEEVRADDRGYVVHAVEREPDPGAIVTQSLTYPWAAVAVERAPGVPEVPHRRLLWK